MEYFEKSPKILLFHIILFLLLTNICLTFECPKYKPILKSNECYSIYCTPQEFSSKECEISNEIAKTQWLNNFHIFDKEYMSHISVTKNHKGELFLSSQKTTDDFDKYLFAFNSEGEGLFYDKEKDKYNSFEIIDFETREYADYNNYIEIDNKGYLIGAPIDDDIYLIDYMNNTIKSFSIDPFSIGADTIFKINNNNNLFFTAYVFCYDSIYNNCSLYFQTFKLNLTNLENVKNITNIPTDKDSRIKCFQNEKGYIFCFYSKKIGDNIINQFISIPILEHYVSVINPITFEIDDSILIESNYTSNRMFDEVLNLKNDLYIIAYAIDDEVIKIQFKNIILNPNLEVNPLIYIDYFSNIKEIYINKERKFELNHGFYKSNSICKINDNKFAMILKDYSKDNYKLTNSIILIYIFTIFNQDKNINIRRYSIDFELYNKHANDDVKGYTLGNFFGIILGLTEDKDSFKSIATFLTFGYINATDQENIDTQLKYNNTSSKIIIKNYINEMENNLFGYIFKGVKIISLPNEGDSGFFISNINNKKIELNDIISRDDELQFILSKYFKNGIYSIQFAGILEEPEYEKMNQFAEEIISYPENQTQTMSEEQFYKPQTMMGKKINYKFRLSNCYDSCSSCSEFSEDDNNHKCITCREGFYFKEGTKNCYDKIDEKYYFDKNEKVFLPCYKDCLTCSSNENNDHNMNCLSCENEFKFYNKSKNCLKCKKYVNFEQNECLDEIPDGYFLEDKNLGTIGECHKLCKTCNEGPIIIYGNLHMNCQICLYENSNYKPIFTGDCPNTEEIIDDSDSPIDGECPIDKPILKNGKCVVYCLNEEFSNKTCKINNPIIEVQWLNKFHIFSELNNSFISLANDIISNSKIIFFSQNINKNNDYKEKYIYGFYKNGTGIFYDKTKNIFESLRKIDFPENKRLVDKIGYLEMDYIGYILTTPIVNNLYLIDYEDNKTFKHEIDIPAYSTDKLILMEEESESIDPDYTISYIYCKNTIFLNECYLMMKNFEADLEILDENSSMKPTIKVHYNSQLNCYKDAQNYIRCTYTKIEDNSNYKHVLGIYSSGSLSFEKEFELEKNYDLEPTFDSMINLKTHICVIAYSLPNNKNIIKILIKKIYNDHHNLTFDMTDYIPKIPKILINVDNLYKFEGAKASSNSLVKISYDKFALLVNDFKNNNNNKFASQMVIFIATIYSGYSKVNIRHYWINFNYYNTLISEKIIGYNLNGFFGALIELTAPENQNLRRASFFTFGYVNSTKDIDPMEGNEILLVKKEKIKLSNYLNEIENNIFGYDFINIKVISVPDEKISGYFTLNNQQNKLKPEDIISKTSEISFTLTDTPKTGNYSIIFAPIINEPKYEIMNTYCQKMDIYPKDEIDTEKNYYLPGTLLGKYFAFNFYIKGKMDCYQNCETCYKESNDILNQQCIKCKKDYYKLLETNNCFYSVSDGYYFDKNQKLFIPCYKDCLSCNDSGTEKKMNCLSCDDDYFNYYKKSTNCLDCPKYVDYNQTKCINELPEGYFVDNNFLKTIEKCHELCKTCEKKSDIINNQIYMNCQSCKYGNISIIQIEGNCPTEEEAKNYNNSNNNNNDNNNNNNNNKKNDNNNENSNVLAWVLSSIIIIIILIIVGILFYKKWYKKRTEKEENDYYTMKGKNIKLEDEGVNNFGIN